MAGKHLLAPCRECEHLLKDGPLILEEGDWKMEQIGQGANSRVFKALCRKTGCVHAVKVVNPDTSYSRDLLQLQANPFPNSKFLTQTLLAGHTVHKDLTQDQDAVVAIMQEYLDVDLFSALHDQSAPSWAREFDIWRLASDCLEGLRELHVCGICHGDVKPENIMLQRRQDGQPRFKLTDFGHSYHISEETHPGGTSVYLAPEHVIGKMKRSSTADLFSLGLVLTEVICGESLLPQSLIESYDDADKSIEPARQQYHLVVLASLGCGKPSWTGHVVRSYYGQRPRSEMIRTIEERFPQAMEELECSLEKLRSIKKRYPDLFGLVDELLSTPNRRPSIELAMHHLQQQYQRRVEKPCSGPGPSSKLRLRSRM